MDWAMEQITLIMALYNTVQAAYCDYFGTESN